MSLSVAKQSGAGPRNGRLESLLAGGNGSEIRVSDGQLPSCLLEANGLVRAGQIEKARIELQEDRVEVVRQTLAGDPSRTDLMYVLAGLLRDTNQPERSEPWLRRILDQEPHPLVCCDLARLCARDTRRCGEGLDHAQRALALDPACVEAMSLCADALAAFGRTEQCVAMLDRALDLEAGHASISLKRLWYLRYLPGQDRDFFRRRYAQWGQAHMPAAPSPGAWACEPDSDRRLRVAILSPELQGNTPAMPLVGFADLCDRDQFEVYGYDYSDSQEIEVGRCASRFDCYRDVWGWPQDRIVETIKADRVDILLEVGGYSTRNPLRIMAHGPAPVQVDFGGMDTLGLPAVQYRLTDQVLDPPQTLDLFSEHSVYLPGGLPLFVPSRDSPAPPPLPAEQNGYITFGSFNNSAKINAWVKALWARVLKTVPDCRLVMKCPALSDPAVQAAFREDFDRLGIDPRRISLHGSGAYLQHMEILGQTDLLLDTYPFNGWRTTLEGLWMGVPTLSLVGDLFVSRVGLDTLGRIGLEIFAARGADEYVAKAAAFARQPGHLAAIRRALRGLVLRSPLCDARRFTGEMEVALRHIWRHACSCQAARRSAEGANRKE